MEVVKYPLMHCDMGRKNECFRVQDLEVAQWHQRVFPGLHAQADVMCLEVSQDHLGEYDGQGLYQSVVDRLLLSVLPGGDALLHILVLPLGGGKVLFPGLPQDLGEDRRGMSDHPLAVAHGLPHLLAVVKLHQFPHDVVQPSCLHGGVLPPNLLDGVQLLLNHLGSIDLRLILQSDAKVTQSHLEGDLLRLFRLGNGWHLLHLLLSMNCLFLLVGM